MRPNSLNPETMTDSHLQLNA